MPNEAESQHTQILSNEALSWRPDPSAVAPDGGQPPGLRLAPYERDERFLWSIEQALVDILGPEGWPRLRDALPSISEADRLRSFGAGVIVGAAEAARDMVRDQINGLIGLVAHVIEFYSLVLDVKLWEEMLAVWTSEPGTGIDPFVEFLRNEHPELLESMTTLRTMERGLEAAIQPFVEAAERGADDVLALAGRKVSDLVIAAPTMVGMFLRQKVEVLIAAKGDPRRQGEIFGATAAPAVITAVIAAAATATTLAAKLYDSARIGLALVRGFDDVTVRAMLLARATTRGIQVVRIETAASEAMTTLAGVADKASHRTAAMRAYEAVARKTGPHRNIRRMTKHFNDLVREETGLSIHDTEYIALRLDSHHYLEKTWRKKFPLEWETKFGITSDDDMPAVAIHTEFHIRSGANMAKYHGLLGAEREVSLTKQIQEALKNAQEKKPFTKLLDVFEAHEQFYKEEVPKLWEVIAPEFLAMKAKLLAD
jgi:hypothetical protein